MGFVGEPTELHTVYAHKGAVRFYRHGTRPRGTQ